MDQGLVDLARRPGAGADLVGLLATGVPVDAMDAAGWTAAAAAASSGQIGNLHVLIAAGADINQTNRQGQTLLELCSKNNQVS